jgi:hypothetical protein
VKRLQNVDKQTADRLRWSSCQILLKESGKMKTGLAELTGVATPIPCGGMARVATADLAAATRRDAKRIFYSLNSTDITAVIETLRGIFCVQH